MATNAYVPSITLVDAIAKQFPRSYATRTVWPAASNCALKCGQSSHDVVTEALLAVPSPSQMPKIYGSISSSCSGNWIGSATAIVGNRLVGICWAASTCFFNSAVLSTVCFHFLRRSVPLMRDRSGRPTRHRCCPLTTTL